MSMLLVFGGLALAVIVLGSIHVIGPTEVGLVTKRFSWRRLRSEDPIAFAGEAGYQADLLRPGVRFKLWLVNKVDKFPWVQVPAGEIGVVVAQIGDPLPVGAKSAESKGDIRTVSDVRRFLELGGRKGVQRQVLPPGTLLPIHPVGFLVITRQQVFGVPVSPELGRASRLSCGAFGLRPEQLLVTIIQPMQTQDGEMVRDMCGIVTALEGQPLPSGAIASRLGEFDDVHQLEAEGRSDAEIIETLIGSKNSLHNNYQDFDAFLRHGGRIGLQHDPLLYGAYVLNPFLVRVEMVPMLVVNQGEVAVVKAYVGLPTQDTSGPQFKFGSIVRPGHRGIWQEPLRTGKYAINPRCYEPEIVPTAILTLNWADANSRAHDLDRELKQIIAKSKEGFVFAIDLQVQIHVPDTKAPRVISMVGTMKNLATEVLQSAVGNHFRDKLQSMAAIEFIEQRQGVQDAAMEHIKGKLDGYEVETRGVYIQDVVLPETLVSVLTQREIAHQQQATFQSQKAAEDKRVDMEQAKGRANMQAELAKSEVGIKIAENQATAKKAQAQGDAALIEATGRAEAVKLEATGLARARGYEAQVRALGANQTAIINVATALADGKVKIGPEILSVGGAGGGLESLIGVTTNLLAARPPHLRPAP
jgi:regulator of protease activity HflC (stomatin/prohibitin superfamily)